MPSKAQGVTHVFEGGWATDIGANADVIVEQDGKVRIPFLTRAENVFYELNGAPHKIGGSQKFYPSGSDPALESGATVTGVYDYWNMAGGNAQQKRVAHVGTKVYDLDAPAEIGSGFTLDAVPHYNTFDDLLIIANDSTDVPYSWDQTTFQILSATAPNFAFSETHKLRLFAAGDDSNPSRLYYTATEDPTDWIGASSGTIDVNPGDGDRITGLASFRGELWIFKGPNKGSIHRLSGSSPLGVNGSGTTVGQDSFALEPFATGIGSVGQNTIFMFGNDLAFVNLDGSFHTLSGTAAFGDMLESSLSRPINNWIRDNVVQSRLAFAQSVVDTQRGYVLTTLTIGSGDTNNEILMLDFRFEQPRWSRWPAENMASIGMMRDGDNRLLPTAFGGGYDGFTWKLNGIKRNINTSTAISARVDTPFLNYGRPFNMKQLSAVGMTLRPAGGATVTFGWKRDTQPEQSFSMPQQLGGARLAPADPVADNFTLDLSTLGGSQSRDVFYDPPEGGEFRRVRYSVSNGELNKDLEVHGIHAEISIGSRSVENGF